MAHIPLSEFFLRVGREAYEDQWPAEEITLMLSQGRIRAEDREGPASTVAADVGLAGSSGILRAAIELVLPSSPALTEKLRAEDEDLVEQQDLLADVGDDDNDDPPRPPQKQFYVVNRDFWEGDWLACIEDWRASRLCVPIRQISEGIVNPNTSLIAAGRPLIMLRSDLADIGIQRMVGRIMILQAETVIGKMFQINSLPVDMWKARNKTYPNRLVDEVVSAAWRTLAIEQPKIDGISTAYVLKSMQNYLDCQSIDGETNGLSDKTLEAVARKIVRQIKDRDLTGVALVNSTPLKASSRKPRNA